MYVSRKPAVHTGVSLLVTALSMTLTAPVLATPTTAARTTMTASKPVSAKAKNPKPQVAIKTPAAPEAKIGHPVIETPASGAAANGSAVVLSVPAPSQGLPPAAVVAKPVAASFAVPAPAVTAAVPAAPVPVAASTVVAAAPAAPAAQSVNPYLAGWYRPVPAAALPAMAVGQLNYSARYVSDSMTSLPGKLADALPSIKTVHPTGGRDLVVANLRCPAEMVTGQYMLPANAMREGVNGLFSKLNETQLLKFDIQLVCS